VMPTAAAGLVGTAATVVAATVVAAIVVAAIVVAARGRCRGCREPVCPSGSCR
jgi:hypothetical protein